MTDTTDTGGKMYSLAINAPKPLNITFTDGSQLIFPLSGKASFTGDVEESARVFFDAVIRHRDSQLEAERQRAEDMTVSRDAMTDKRDTALAKVYELEAEILKLKADQVPVGFTSESALDDVADGDTAMFGPDRVVGRIPLFTAPQKPVLHPQLLSDIRQCVIDATAWCTHRTPPDYVSSVNAWLAVGGIVKVTDKCHPSLMTSVNVPHNVIRTYFDASGGRSDIVTLSDKREMKDMSSIVKDGE